MHDLVRDMALRITNGNSKLKMKWTEDLHAVYFHTFGSAEIEVPPGWSPNCPKLSTLLLPHFSIKRIPDSFFRHMCGLKVLNLEGCKDITELPNCVSDMVNLTALILGGCARLMFVPPLGKLKQLRDLDLSCTSIQDLPQGWGSLVNLERLNLKKCQTLGLKIIPKGTFSQFHRLQLLLLPPFGKSLSPLRDLEQLGLSRLPNLVGLFYGGSEPYLLPVGTFSSLKILWIHECHNMKQLFTVQLLQTLQNLETLDIKNCEGLEEIAADGNGVGQGGGERIQLTSSGATATVILPKLRCLSLNRLPQLKNICKAAMICNSIKEIEIFDCPKVKRLPLFLPTTNGLPSPPSTLRKIRGDVEWWELLEWDSPYPKSALDPLFIGKG
ncbi:unnamed protein product [Coffea canephora]|uniref:Disease resistance protein At4g27190-like leucine-rich repeats domain-containing protein n=1 Tax=Coffea canephora TaxID=49390 RepID=A0A068V6Q1_COFCA|nr:unnamed protein product [Coffea canephora]